MRVPSRPHRVRHLSRALRGVASAALVLAVSACSAESGAARSVPAGQDVVAGPAASGAPASFPASDVLRAWDRARARAFADGDVAALRGLYVEGSAAGTSDVRLLRAYLRRGFRVEGMRMQVLALEVLHEGPGRLRLLVTDRLAGAVAVGGGSRTPLPLDQASTRVVELRRAGRGPWQVAEVSASARRPAGR